MLLRAKERGLSLSDFEGMTVGMIMGYIIAYDNERLSDDEKADEVKIATQADFDRF